MKLVLMLLTICGVACIIWIILITMKVIALNLGKSMCTFASIPWRTKNKTNKKKQKQNKNKTKTKNKNKTKQKQKQKQNKCLIHLVKIRFM